VAEIKDKSASSTYGAYSEFLSGLFGLFLIGLFVYAVGGGLLAASFLKRFPVINSILQWSALVIILGIGTVRRYSTLRKRLQAMNAKEEVDAAFEKLQVQAPSQDVAEISTEKVAQSVKGTKVSIEQLTRLVQQRKQELLIDDDYFRDEISSLIVNYLQPLPRNAKRLLNRFRVTLLIANNRGLLTTEPRVSTQQIGKWLVLMERWPQLGRSLSVSPEKLRLLEELSSQQPSKTVTVSLADSFMESIKLLAPSYAGDEDLRKFLASQPMLATIVNRLTHYASTSANPL